MCWLAAGTYLGLSLNSHAAETKALRPNVVLILADDMGYSDLGCYGSEISTPNIDHLAKQGIKMTQFYTTPRCCPTRAALLTGEYPQEAGIGGMMEDHGIPGYRGELSYNCLTIAEELRRANYETLMVGKWHVCHIYFDGKKQLNHESNVPFWDNKNDWPLQRGFQHYFGTIHGVCSYYDPFSLTVDNTPVQSVKQGFYYTDAIAQHAVENIDQYANGDKPFFMYVAFTAPHWPLQAPEADIAKYRQRYMVGWDQIRTNRYHRQLQMGIIDKDWKLSPRDPRVPPWTKVKDKAWEANRMATFAAMVERLDTGVGRILNALKEKGVDKNTLVIFLSDNGGCAEVVQPGWYDVPSRTRSGEKVKVGNHDHSVFAGPEDVWQSYGVPWANVSDTPFLLYKHFTHEGGISTPFIVRWPEVIQKPGTVSRQIGHVTDIMATLVDVAGATHPKTYKGHAILPLEGSSLLPIFEGWTRSHPQPIFWEHEGNRAVRQGKWKLVARHRQPWSLFDVEADRTELNDLADRYPDKVKEMAALYDAWARRCHVVPPEQLPHRLRIVPAKVEASAEKATEPAGT